MKTEDPRLEALFDQYVEHLFVAEERLDLRALCSDVPHLLEPLATRVRQLDEVTGLLAARRRPRIGGRLGRYRIEEELGKGTMSILYRAFDTQDGRQVALKLLPPECALEDELLRRFEREGEILASLDHPNIVRFYSREHVDRFHFLTTELLSGPTLAELVTPDGLGAEEVMAVALPVAAALEAAHACGVAHRDLKPANGMYASDGVLKLLDFGLARTGRSAVDSITVTGSLVGTVPYMAPEQLLGERGDAISDVYSFGVLLYELASGRRPFGSTSLPKLIRAVCERAPDPLPPIAGDSLGALGRLIAQCLERDRDRRPSGMAEVRFGLLEAGVSPRQPCRLQRH